LSFDSGTLYIDASANRVGVGTTAPLSPLQVAGNAAVTGSYTYTSSKTVAVNVQPAAFRVKGGAEDETVNYSENYGVYIDAGAAPYDVALIAPVDLPDGATVSSFQCYYYDNSASSELVATVRLGRRTTLALSSQEMASISISSSGSTTNIQAPVTRAISSATVDNEGASYYVDVFMTTGVTTTAQRFYGCKVFCSVDKIGP